MMVAHAPARRRCSHAHWEVLRSIPPTRGACSTPPRRCALVPVLRARARRSAPCYEPDAADIDVHALHQGFLRGCAAPAARSSATPRCGALRAPRRRLAGRRRRRALAGAGRRQRRRRLGRRRRPARRRRADRPRSRSAAGLHLRAAAPASTRALAAVGGVDESWYVKPDAGLLLGSPANADPVAPHDVQPEELDIALAIDRIEAATTLTIRRAARTWAGLRSFVADGDLVGGFDADAPGFFWLAAQGGYGIQTSAAMGEACAALVRGEPLPAPIARFGLTADDAVAGTRCVSRPRGLNASSTFHGPLPCASSPAALATETNTFAPMPTGLATLSRPRLLPGGHAPRRRCSFRRAALGGAPARQDAGWDRRRGPGRRGAAERHDDARRLRALRDELLADLRAALPVDMVVLGLHGAMVADGYDDCEGDLLARVRAIVGPDVVVGAELDPHSHLTPAMLANADLLIAFKEYPHTDVLERALRARRPVRGAWSRAASARSRRWSTARCSSRCTRRASRRAVRRPDPGDRGQGRHLSISISHGFAWGDVPRWAPRCWSTPTATPAKAQALARRLADELIGLREQLSRPLPAIDDALDEALAFDGGPVVLADGADNPGGGAAGDSTFFLRRMLERGIGNACHRPAVGPGRRAHRLRRGRRRALPLRIGGKIGAALGRPARRRLHGQGLRPT